ncbi:bifunctional helix-turn-helix transcriptional regulator/GNAT family N-acetyltransferase [Paracoccus onubensis]|uniref:bifunctional helix-turn-helix transcriptional regulator/GNAT family N-acetyltransferase n=1 Tax=Paracoccus onubensis TaxID=1675788 RepID=UPI00272F593B|nr:bifunctional helix-turn-helix transcriptional regulator/GNAT family N-acetyltransferase [Paracoccus onubensis]MDP0926942.1 bifunctional helix-turn-helix transcriptional regulator/GNAT family N-acetyltransferase [Paracoccus onubensis]
MNMIQDENPSDSEIASVRLFNRFHTRLVGALNDRLLASDYSLPQVRILYEIANARPDAPPSARELGKALRMDTGYLSRIVSGLEGEGLVMRTPSSDNAKRLALTLTDRGAAVFNGLNAASAEEVAALLAPLSKTERSQLVGAMHRIRRLLGDDPDDRTFILRDPRPGDLGWIMHRQGMLYAREYGWDWTFEALVAEIVGQFVKEFAPDRERCWIAEMEGEVVGSVFVVRQDDETAKLRLLYVDPAARGRGLGRRLVEECIRFAQAKGYRRMVLWTNDILISARRIYEAAGFTLIEEEPHHSFGKDLVGQVWGRNL